jgi:hypothetical protein
MKAKRQEKPMHAVMGAHKDLINRKKRNTEKPAIVHRVKECPGFSPQQAYSFGLGERGDSAGQSDVTPRRVPGVTKLGDRDNYVNSFDHNIFQHAVGQSTIASFICDSCSSP